jgi:CheY-like chemotaxis protein
MVLRRPSEPTGAVLVAEHGAANAQRAVADLSRCGLRTRAGRGVAEALELLRCEAFDAAVVAVELMIEGRPLLERLAQLPGLSLVVATGPPGDWEMERRARMAGARAYLPRPVAASTWARTFRKVSLRRPP